MRQNLAFSFYIASIIDIPWLDYHYTILQVTLTRESSCVDSPTTVMFLFPFLLLMLLDKIRIQLFDCLHDIFVNTEFNDRKWHLDFIRFIVIRNTFVER